MSDVNVTVQPVPINVTVDVAGVQGVPGAVGPSAASSVAGITGLSITGSSSITGLATLSGTNIVSVTLKGNDIIFSGDTSSFLTSANLQATGTLLYNFASAISGNLIQTGVNLGATGSAAYNYSSAISGNLIATGVSLGSRIDTVSNNLTSTGSSAYNYSSSISGNLIATGSALSSRLTTQENLSKVTGILTTGASLTGLVSFSAGSNITLTNLANSIQIAAAAGGSNSISLSIESPSSFDNVTLRFLKTQSQVSQIESIIQSGNGSSGFYLPWTLKYHTNRTSTGIEIISGGTNTTGTTFPTYLSSFDNSIIPSGNFLWLEIKSGISGVINEFSTTIEFV